MKKLFLLSLICSLTISAFAADVAKQSVLQFRLVVDKPTATSEEVALIQTNQANGKACAQKFQVEKKALLDASAVKSAVAGADSSGKAQQIQIALTDKGAKEFAKITRENIGKQLAIFVDGKIYSAPIIQSEIPGGKIQISGSFSEQEAKDFAGKINSAL